MATLKVHILKPGLFSSVQDKGRIGYRYFGIPSSGYLDKKAANRALQLVGNPAGTSVIEINQVGPSLYFEHEAWIALSGAHINTNIPMETLTYIEAGTTLDLKGIDNGMRTYLAIQGDWKVPKILGSSSAYSYPSIGIGRLKKDDIITIETQPSKTVPSSFKYEHINYNAIEKINIQPGPEFELLDVQSKAALFEQKFTISASSNRMAAILNGPSIKCEISQIASSAVFPGTIQLFPNGALVVLLQDGQTTGGYPRIGMIELENLDDFNQLRIGREFGMKNVKFKMI